MHILKNTNFDFVRWRWHAIALSWVIILAGAADDLARNGVPLGVEFSGGTIVIVQVRSARRTCSRCAPRSTRRSPAAARTRWSSATAIRAANQVMVRVPDVGAESGGSLSQAADAVDDALQEPPT